MTNQIYSTDNPSPHGQIVRYVEVSTSFVGFHRYDNAPQEVAFLKNLHRHKFGVKATIQVWHDDRELEFFMVLEELDRNIIPFVTQKYPLGSCEMIAEDIMWGLINTYGDHRSYILEVNEDDENRALAHWMPNNLFSGLPGIG